MRNYYNIHMKVDRENDTPSTLTNPSGCLLASNFMVRSTIEQMGLAAEEGLSTSDLITILEAGAQKAWALTRQAEKFLEKKGEQGR